ncbi:MAG TPA: right-handed parallel beta-helix repeat-containing protein [Fimbriimonas sp.]|nr:right-handed parallel beta-helix repeat-containing protein [Fimbriimonas sp.]
MTATILLAIVSLAGNGVPARSFVVSTTGSDANGGTADRPFRTIQKGIDALGVGDRLTIKGGTYNEYLVLKNSGLYFDRSIVIEGDSGSRVIIDPVGVSKPAGVRGAIDTNGADHLVIKNLKVRNSPDCGIAVRGSWDVRLEDCTTTNSSFSGVFIDKAHKVDASKVDVEKACMLGGEESVSIKRSTDVTFRDSLVHDTNHEGIDVKEGSKHVRVLRNRVWNVERQGLYADAWESETFDIRFDANIVYNCMVGLVACSETGGLLRDVWFTNNVVYDCRGPGMMLAKWGDQSKSHPIRNVYYLNNTVVNCGNGGKMRDWGGGMLLENDQAENVVVMNNILSSNPQGQLRKNHLKLVPKKLTIANNLIDGPSERFGAANIYGQPSFLDFKGRDLRLGPTSAAIDAGKWRSDLGTRDAAGVDRRRGKQVDIGAYEFRG